VLEREPDWQRLPSSTPVSVRQSLRRCLQEDANQRLAAIADARKTIEQAQRGRNRWRIAGVCGLVLVLGLAAVSALRLQRPARVADSFQPDWMLATGSEFSREEREG